MLKPKDSEYEKIQCPYQATHLIDRCRFQLHLTRCRKSHKHVQLVPCPFNVTHMLNEPELSWHVTVCPDRRSFENFKYSFATNTKSAPSPVTVVPEVEASEDWDEEPDVPTYNPETYVQSAPVLRLCQNAPRLERKTFRKAEHLRLRGMEK